ncbi:MAG: oxygen-dependent coproporphyrinogen oxidase [Myxococcaceae bacterium]
MTPNAEIRERMSRFVDTLQDDICTALEREDGRARFREDVWQRPGGGGGRTRVISNGAVFEKGGVNVSKVHGELSDAFAKKLPGSGRTFFATGISLVLHPENPYVPTVHANFRCIEQGDKAWFGGGMDLTPYYLFEEDAAHFHRALQSTCEAYQSGAYARFKRACDAYFFLKHRGEARGIGGVFFEDMGGDLLAELAFVESCGRAFLPAYLPVVARRKGTPFEAPQRTWQEVRRGRYVEFNLVYDRGTLFGLETQGRVESILMSLPPSVQWPYDFVPPLGTPEAELLDALKSPREWI